MTRLVRPGGLVVVDDMWLPAVRVAVAYGERNLGLGLEDGGFRWKRRRFGGGVPEGTGDTALLRLPATPPELSWDEFVPPY
jgi:hypothetical protein